ncbi:hypothetical protein ABZX12_04630 [Kribbella sp. NPDC003505]|uniref:hypothetical protein n=1 Tax=Kribbella sp. NPDC003505 TaxID=3154448 RepID=UPI0033A108CC
MADADVVGTTLSGFTPYTTKTDGPDLDLVARLAAAITHPTTITSWFVNAVE